MEMPYFISICQILVQKLLLVQIYVLMHIFSSDHLLCIIEKEVRLYKKNNK